MKLTVDHFAAVLFQVNIRAQEFLREQSFFSTFQQKILIQNKLDWK